jgi:hypothetical protein
LQEDSNLEQKTKQEFVEFYEGYKEFKKLEKENNFLSPTLLFDVNAFNQATTYSNREYNAKSQKYTKKQIRQYLERPEYYDRQLREVSVYLYSNSQEYKNLMNYLSKMLTHDYILVPDGNLYDMIYNSNKTNNIKLLKSFFANLEFIENYNLKAKLSDVESVLVREDIYFGYERTDGENCIWQQLPSNYSRILGWDEYGGFTMEFDFTYFTKPNISINNYASEFKEKFDLYKKNNKQNNNIDLRWQKLSDNAIVFKFDKSVLYGLPQFSGILDEILSLSEYKDLQETTSRTNNFKLIHQKIPQNTDKEAGVNKFLIDDKSAVKFHNNLKSNLPEGVGCATTPMSLTEVILKNNQFDEDLVGKAERNMFVSAGVSQLLFSSDGKTSIGLNRSIEADSALMFSLLRQEELFMKKKLKMFNANDKGKLGKFKWKLIFPNLTIFNMEDYRTALMNNAQFGYSKFCTSMSQSDIIGLLYLEKTLGLINMMEPLKSSNTTPGESKGGKPPSDPNSLGDAGIDQIDRQSNADRSK